MGVRYQPAVVGHTVLGDAGRPKMPPRLQPSGGQRRALVIGGETVTSARCGRRGMGCMGGTPGRGTWGVPSPMPDASEGAAAGRPVSRISLAAARPRGA